MPNYGAGLGGAASGVAAGAMFGLPGMIGGGLLGGLTGLFGGGDAPGWQDVSGPGVDAFGQNIARDNMSRYGFQGVYQQFLQEKTEEFKRTEQSRILKLASGLTPGMASMRGGLASQGLGGATSNVMAGQQRQQAMGKAMDVGTQAYEASNARLDTSYLTLTGENEQMRSGASRDLMTATGMQTNAQLDVDKFNTTGRMGQANLNYQANQAGTNQFLGMLGGMGGQYAGMAGYKKLFGGVDAAKSQFNLGGGSGSGFNLGGTGTGLFSSGFGSNANDRPLPFSLRR